MSPESIALLVKYIEPMLNNRLANYIVPGLDSAMVGDQGDDFGKIRLFDTTERATRDEITPHSHRFNFVCFVLSGCVKNAIYYPDDEGEEWCVSTIDQVCDGDGLRNYTHTRETTPTRFRRVDSVFSTGNVYAMESHQIHSIEFWKGSKVLFFEGPQLTNRSQMIEPWVRGKVVPTFRTEPWMFEQLEGA